MKLIKIEEDHYVVVDETIQPVNGYYYDAFINKIKSTNGAEYGEASHCWQITHSTEPLEHGTEPFADGVQYVKIYYKIKPISLQEVKELIGVVDVEKKAEEYADFSNDYVPLTFGYKFNTNTKRDYLAGYNQALEDNKDKKYTEEDIIWAIQEAYGHGQDDEFDGVNKIEKSIKAITKYLQPKTQWEYIGECKGNNGNGCFMDSPGHDCGCYKRVPKTGWEVEIIDGKLKMV